MIKREKTQNFRTTRKAIHQEDLTIVNTYTPKIGTPNFRETLLGQIDSDTTIVNDFNISLSSIDKPSRQKKNQQRNIRVKLHHRLNGLSKYLQNIVYNN
jgi:hypothetical protein